NARLWIKRDDLSSDVYGGNKIRKLEFLLARARARDAQRLITAGAAGSHHALATAVFGRQLGFASSLVLFPQPITDHVRQVLLTDAALGAELRFAPRMTSVPTALVGARLAHWRERTFAIVPGGSDVTGTLGYVNATLELGTQIEQRELPAPDLIVLAAGTLGTAAGIAIGLTLLDLRTQIIATRITSRLVTNERALHGLIRATCSELERRGVPVAADHAVGRVTLAHDQVGAGYGQPTAAADAAHSAFAPTGLALDPTYTAKAAAELLALRVSRPTATLLFWHTLSATMPAVVLPPESVLPARFRAYLQRNR
ncbi:MAG: 1-aminocyclopropane-1-carboxylate deaminase/D-cysteine desulfhydrase, partial [Longimicrobiales bacterium]